MPAMPKREKPLAAASPEMHGLPPEALAQVAEFFQALAEPARLRLLNQLREGERKVGELAELAGSTPANVSRHMALLQSRGLVTRESRGNCVFYAIADPAIYQLCDLVCGTVARQHSTQQARSRAAFGLG